MASEGNSTSTQTVFDRMNATWNEVVSMTPLIVPESGITESSSLKELDLSGPSPSVQPVLVFKGGRVLIFADHDIRPGRGGLPRPTKDTFKMTSGFGGGNPEDPFAEGDPVDVSLYGFPQQIKENVLYMGAVFVARGEGWGPVITIPFYVTFEADPALEYLNSKWADNDNCRFRDFRTIHLNEFVKTGNSVSAVYDENKLVKINARDHGVVPSSEGEVITLWDEGTAREKLLPIMVQWYEKNVN